MSQNDLGALKALQSELGIEALAVAYEAHPKPEHFLPLFHQLEKCYPHEIARKAAEQVILRDKARSKSSRAEEMFFERTALEQALSEAIARHRATRYARARLIIDTGCGIEKRQVSDGSCLEQS